MRPLSDDTFRRLCELMYASVGLSFAWTKKPLVSSRLAARLAGLGLDSYDDYLARLADGGDPQEFQVAVDLLTTNETYFFREPAHFLHLERELSGGRLRRPAVWSAASSFGDEAYSIAMLLADLQNQGRVDAGWSVLGTDISDRVLQTACAATYPVERLRDVSPERLRRHCLRGFGPSEGLVQIQPRLREQVRFGHLNLCRPFEEIGPFDVVFLRNVLIYFDAQTRREVVDRVLGRLRPGGLFFVGTAEGRIHGDTSLTVLAPGVFRKSAR